MRPFAPIQNAALAAERGAMLDEIRRAFAGVTREGGVSWKEAEVIGDGGTIAEQAAARISDADQHWTQLVDDGDWQPGIPLLELDPIGLRYYLPAAMTCVLASLEGGFLPFVLEVRDDDEHQTAKFPELTPEQNACVAQFVALMHRTERAEFERKREHEGGEWWTDPEWHDALHSRWKRLLPPEGSEP